MIKNPPANAADAGDVGSIPGSGRSPGEGNGNPLQYSCLGNPMDRGARRATVHGVAKGQTHLATKYLQGQGRRILCIYNTQQTRTCFFVKLWMLVIES